MATPLNKSSAYVQSLVDFILDTKPYHSKLTEIVEEYQFFDDVRVKIEEATFVRTQHKAAWTYNFFSGGPSSDTAFRAQRVMSPDFNGLQVNSNPVNNPGRWKAGRDENTDMALVPLVFSKKQFDGVGVADAWMELDGTGVLPYVEGHDYFQSHGSFEFQIKRIYDPLLTLSPTWAETRADGVVSQATTTTMTLEQDLTRPQSAINKLITLVTNLQAHLNLNPSAHPGWALAITSCGTLLSTLNSGTIPPAWTTSPGNPDLLLAGDYSEIVQGATAAGTSAPTGFAGWIGEDTTVNKYVDEAFSALLPPLLFAMHTDIGLHKNGVIEYDDVVGTSITVQNITANPNVAYEEWTLTAVFPGPSTWSVTGSQAGFIGTVTAGTSFSSPHISFDTLDTAVPVIGETVVLTARNQITVHPTAPLETWNIIKVNPRSYTRPAFVSTNYGQIYDLSATPGSVSLTDITMPAGTYIITFTGATTFHVSCSADPLFSYDGDVGVQFTDGGLGFTIVAGSLQPFQVGDYFLIEVVNGPAHPHSFDLYYGYDLDSYDNPDLVYNNTNPLDPDYNRFLDFRFDSRFSDYDVADMGLVVTQAAIDGRGFRLTAVPDVSRPIATLKRDGTTVSNAVDLTAEDDEIAPVVVTGVPVFTLPGDPNPAVDIELYYATDFLLEYSDDGFATTTTVGVVPVGGSYSNPALGISFNLVPGSKPFIAASCDNGLLNPRVEGGDVFFFSVDNPPPMLANAPIGLTGATVPRLIMHGDSYYASASANWTVTITGLSTYTVNGIYNSGVLTGTQMPGYPVTGELSLATANTVANTTYRDSNVHFTLVAGRGLTAGDSFTFQTNDPRPTFLVHGSVSGWQPDAEYDKWYFNGKIGFKIRSAKIEAYQAYAGWPDVNYPLRMPESLGYHNYPSGYLKVNYLRPDAPANRYLFQRNGGGALGSGPSSVGFLVRRTDVDVQGFCPLNGAYTDQYVEVEVQDPSNDFQFNVIPSEFDFWNAQDAIIVRSNISALNPSSDDYVIIKKTEEGSFSINLDYSGLVTQPNLAPLSPLSVNTSMTDFTTGFGGVPLEATSPEIGPTFLTGWIPTYVTKLDTPVSIAQFPDSVAIFEVRSAQTNQLVGVLKPRGDSLLEPTDFEFDTSFFNTYLPLNSQANLVTYGTGLDENVRVMISEKLNVMSAGSAIFENSLFNDNVFVNITEADQKYIITRPEGSFSTVVSDSFGNFLPGYDNMAYDNENANGFYGVGTPLTDFFIEAQQLAGIIPLTPVQAALSIAQRAARLDVLHQLLSTYLVGGSVLLTTLPQFLAAIDGTDPINYTPVGSGFGYPAQGMAMDVDAKSTDVNNTAIQEAFSVQLLDLSSSMDEYGFDTQGLDEYGGRSAILFSMSLPPVGTPGIDYNSTVTPLEVAGNTVRTFDVSFSNPPPAMAVPNFQLWAPGDTLPRSVGVVQTISNGRFRFTVPVPLEAKVVVS